MKGNAGDIQIGVVGLGLMGSSIVTCLLMSGHVVKAIAPLPGESASAAARIGDQLIQCHKAGFLPDPVACYQSSLQVSEDYQDLKGCLLVLECVMEDLQIKASVFKKIEAVVGPETILSSNTSAIPISMLQQLVRSPARFIGIHWAEPAYATRFLEIICGRQTGQATADQVFALALQWGKEPTLLKRDIRGFITNRLMYAVYREALSLIGSGKASVEDADKAFRYDAGSWMTLMGIFGRMDYMGLKDYSAIYQSLFPLLSNADDVPGVIQSLLDKNALDGRDAGKFYHYRAKEFRAWEESFARFNQDIYRLAAKYLAAKV